MMLRCREVTQLVGSDELARAPWRVRFGVRLHLAMCRFCRAYARNIRQLGEVARRLAVAEPVPAESVARVVAAVRREADG